MDIGKKLIYRQSKGIEQGFIIIVTGGKESIAVLVSQHPLKVDMYLDSVTNSVSSHIYPLAENDREKPLIDSVKGFSIGRF